VPEDCREYASITRSSGVVFLDDRAAFDDQLRRRQWASIRAHVVVAPDVDTSVVGPRVRKLSQEVYQLDEHERAKPPRVCDGIRGACELFLRRMLRRRRRECRLTPGSIVERELDAQGRTRAEGTNAVKHAHASAVRVSIEQRDATLRLSIRDDGAGGADPGAGSGLTGLRDRAEAIGGTISVESPVGAGTTVLVALPLG
jgi:hypothetical protein